MNKDDSDNSLLRLSDIFLWCFIFSYALLLSWFALFLFAGDWLYSISAQLFEISRRDYILVNYWGMAFTKICAIIFFLFPFISIRIVLRKGRKNP
jgi:hypothetical protein